MTIDRLQVFIHKFIMDLGCPTKYNGTYYLRDGICSVLENPNDIGCLKKNVYLIVAKKYHTGVMNVERSMRTLVDIWWRDQRCGGIFAKKPTNRDLFHTLVARINTQPESLTILDSII